jgi:hypothetical protein
MFRSLLIIFRGLFFSIHQHNPAVSVELALFIFRVEVSRVMMHLGHTGSFQIHGSGLVTCLWYLTTLAPHDGGSKFLPNSGIHLQDKMLSQPWKSQTRSIDKAKAHKTYHISATNISRISILIRELLFITKTKQNPHINCAQHIKEKNVKECGTYFYHWHSRIQSYREVIYTPKFLKMSFTRIYYGQLIYYINLLSTLE